MKELTRVERNASPLFMAGSLGHRRYKKIPPGPCPDPEGRCGSSHGGVGSVRLGFPIVALIGMVQMLPGVPSAKLLNGRRRHVQLLGPVCSGVLPSTPARIPVLQHGHGLLLAHAGVGGLLTLEPDIVPVPPTGRLNGAWQAGSRVSQAVVPDLIDGKVRKFPGDLGIGVALLGEIAPDDDDCSSWFGHFYLMLWFGLHLGLFRDRVFSSPRISKAVPMLNRGKPQEGSI